MPLMMTICLCVRLAESDFLENPMEFDFHILLILFFKKVSWIRHRDLHILTVGTYTYTTDQRFTTTHHKETDEWTLQIKFAQKRDAGLYDCQISTQPIKSYSVRLNLVGECQNGLESDRSVVKAAAQKTKFFTLTPKVEHYCSG